MGFICNGDPSKPNLLSGMPYSMWHALSAEGVDLVPLTAVPDTSRHPDRMKRIVRRFVPAPIRENHTLRAVRDSAKASRTWMERRLSRPDEYREMIDRARAMSRTVQYRIDSVDVDLLFGVCISSALYALQTDLPIVYASDATARLINATYPKFIHRSEQYKLACDELERTAMGRLSFGVFASERTYRSAIEDYGLAPSRARVVPLGANVTPEPGEVIQPDAPSRTRLDLLVIARDPTRKRVHLCIDIAEQLLARGWRATLHVIGPPTRRCLHSAAVVCHGELKLNHAEDARIHRQALRDCHFMLLPSLGEMFGIAPCEAAHFGRPSIVSDAGGLPTVVQHGKTGLVLPVEAGAEDFVHAIEAIACDETRYADMSAAALARAHSVLSWNAFARELISIFRLAVGNRS